MSEGKLYLLTGEQKGMLNSLVQREIERLMAGSQPRPNKVKQLQDLRDALSQGRPLS